MRVTYHGHSAFLVETSAHRLVIDPFFTDNPVATTPASAVRCDYILITHGHEDHTCDAETIARANDATIIANFEIAEYYLAKGLKAHGLNPGGGANFPFGRVVLTPAIHTSSINAGLNPIYMGTACGIVIEAEGKRLYHAGDTALFSDMKLIARRGIDLALIPIGDNYTMGPEDALDALDFLTPKIAVPMHYQTWPVIAQDAVAFSRAAANRGHVVAPLAPGQSLDVR